MKKVFAIVMALALVAAMFAGCGNSNSAPAATTAPAAANSDAPAAASAAVKIGMSGPLTGPAAQYGMAVANSAQIAVEEINALGGLQFELNCQDDEHDAEKAVSAYNMLKDWGMQMMCGTVTTAPCLAVGPEAAEDHIFMLTPSASAAEVPMAGENVYQICFTDPNQGAGAADVIAAKNLGSSIGIIYDSSTVYSTGIYDSFVARAAELGLNIVCSEAFTADNSADLSTQVDKCQAAGADLVFLPIYYQEAATILNRANSTGYAPLFFGVDGMDGILALEGFDTSLAEGVYMLTPFAADAKDERTVNFVTKYVDRFGDVPNQFGADAYDVIYAMYEACNNAGITGNESAQEICDKMIEQFNSMTFTGLTGSNMTWSPEGTVSKVATAVVITDGVYVGIG